MVQIELTRKQAERVMEMMECFSSCIPPMYDDIFDMLWDTLDDAICVAKEEKDET